ncbi:MAG: amino acid ABC transporter substrate-binding protein [Pedobacter sp.]|nr:MAG: amino acid ABC transporter substrate-binding protein [Pedobacter sp.]
MQKRVVLIFLSLFFLAGIQQHVMAQDSQKNFKTYRVGIFAALYLDSVFNDNGNYKYGKNFPKFALPALDFVQGAQIALDSMPVYSGNIKATIFDSKSYDKPVAALIADKTLDSFDLIIGSVKDLDFTQLAAFAQQKNIPFISATLPNDGGVVDNPFLVIVNSTLRAHCEAIFSYILQSNVTGPIILVRRPGSQEDKVADYFRLANTPDGKPLLNIQTVNITDENDFSAFHKKLDSTKTSVVIGASLSEEFARKLAGECYAVKKKYPVTLIGMPNWDGFASLNRKNIYKDFPVYYTSPYYNYKWDGQSKMIQAVYKKKYKGVPSDMTYKGFETVFLFARLLTRYPDDFMSHLNDYPYKVFSEYNFKPVFVDRKSGLPDYFENKHLYFIKALNGVVSKAW